MYGWGGGMGGGGGWGDILQMLKSENVKTKARNKIYPQNQGSFGYTCQFQTLLLLEPKSTNSVLYY